MDPALQAANQQELRHFEPQGGPESTAAKQRVWGRGEPQAA